MSDNLTDLIQEALDARIEEIRMDNSLEHMGSYGHECTALQSQIAQKNLEDKINAMIEDKIKVFREKKV